MKVFNFVLTVGAALVALLVLVNMLLTQSNGSVQGRVAQVRQVLQQSQGNQQALNALANRVNKDAAQDPALKAVLQKLQISINPAPAASGTSTP